MQEHNILITTTNHFIIDIDVYRVSTRSFGRYILLPVFVEFNLKEKINSMKITFT